MAGPKAPKDPERKRPYFYIMKDKDIYGSVQEDGSIIHFIYESDGRLINSAQIAGNIENKEELGLLVTSKRKPMKALANMCKEVTKVEYIICFTLLVTIIIVAIKK